MLRKVTLSAVLLAFIAPAATAQDRRACNGIYCPQIKASDYASEFQPFVKPGVTWQQVKGQNVLVIKYYAPDGKIAETKTFPQTDYMKPTTSVNGAIAFAGAGTPIVALYGLAPCNKDGTFTFDGGKTTCANVWQSNLADNLFGTQAILCRAYIDQKDKPVQAATCIRETEGFGKDHKPSGVVIDDALAGLGVASLAKDASGKILRPDLVTAAQQGAKIFNSLSR